MNRAGSSWLSVTTGEISLAGKAKSTATPFRTTWKQHSRESAATRLAVTGSGRTDSGVHALGQCAHVDVPAGQFPAERWLKALNGVLPPAIRILRAGFVGQSFHARFSAKGKVYRYRIVNGAVLPPLEIGRAWHVPSPLDRELLGRAAKLFTGRHDFAAFAANRRKEEPKYHAHGGIRSGHWSTRSNRDRILCRRISLQDGANDGGRDGAVCPWKESLQSVELRLERPSRTSARFVAPAAGLYLVRVRH